MKHGPIALIDERMPVVAIAPDDHVFTAEIRIEEPNFAEIQTPFDKPNDLLNHDPIWYFNHDNTTNQVWPDVAGARPARTLTRDRQTSRAVAVRRERRALLIGINAYKLPIGSMGASTTCTR
jgi:hypothetical protein